MLRAMLLEFPEDPACETLDRQYMLGESLLVAPVFSQDAAAKDAAVQDGCGLLCPCRALDGAAGWACCRGAALGA